MNRSLVFDLATGAFIGKREDALFLGPGGTGKSHLAQAIGQAAIQQGYRVLYRETHVLLEELAEAVVDGTRKQYMESIATVPLLIIDDFGMRKLPQTAAEDLLEIIMRRYERASTLLTSNRPVEDWGKLLGDVAAVSRHARPPPAPRPRAQVRPAQLAHQRSGHRRGRRAVIPAAATGWSGLRPEPRGGFAPATRPKPKQSLSKKEKHKAFLLPPVGRDGGLVGQKKNEENLARDALGAVKQLMSWVRLRWPVLK